MEALKRRSLGEVVYGAKNGEVIHSNLLRIRSEGLRKGRKVGNGGSTQVFILVEGVSGYP